MKTITNKALIAKDTLQNDIEKINSKRADLEYKFTVYLQGSYKKSTDIKSSDIDILVTVNQFPQLSDKYNDSIDSINIWLKNSNHMPILDGNFDEWDDPELIARNIFSRSIAGKERVYQDILSIKTCLKNELIEIGYEVFVTSKTLKVKKSGQEFDIVPSIMYCDYDDRINKLNGVGITIYDENTGELISNFPADEWINTKRKNRVTNNYSEIIRAFKNKAYDSNLPLNGYALENLIYNMPEKLISKGFDDSLKESISWILQDKLCFEDFITIDEKLRNRRRNWAKIEKNINVIKEVAKLL